MKDEIIEVDLPEYARFNVCSEYVGGKTVMKSDSNDSTHFVESRLVVADGHYKVFSVNWHKATLKMVNDVNIVPIRETKSQEFDCEDCGALCFTLSNVKSNNIKESKIVCMDCGHSNLVKKDYQYNMED